MTCVVWFSYLIRSYMKKIIFCLLALVAMASCKKEVIRVPDGYNSGNTEKPSGEYVADKSFKRVAYTYHNAAVGSFDTTKLEYITHLHFAFLNPKEDGTLNALTNHTNFEQLNKLAKKHNVKTAISIQGNESTFRNISANKETRSKLVKSLVDFVVFNNLDGVDLDWEYPRANQGSDITFELFAKELATELHAWHKYLSIAVTAGLYAGPVKEGITKGAIDAVDFVNLMAYDGIGSDSENTEHHATYRMAERVLSVWINEKGVPKEKAVLGLPVYGKYRKYTNAEKTTYIDQSMTYSALLSANKDDLSLDYYTNGDNETYWYNNIGTIQAKTNLAKQSGNGVMFWEYAQDARGESSLIKAAYDASK